MYSFESYLTIFQVKVLRPKVYTCPKEHEDIIVECLILHANERRPKGSEALAGTGSTTKGEQNSFIANLSHSGEQDENIPYPVRREKKYIYTSPGKRLGEEKV